jgi:hypothetical protein
VLELRHGRSPGDQSVDRDWAAREESAQQARDAAEVGSDGIAFLADNQSSATHGVQIEERRENSEGDGRDQAGADIRRAAQ